MSDKFTLQMIRNLAMRCKVIASSDAMFVFDALSESESEMDKINDALCKLLPGTHYMDEPDGGNISPLEQVIRMVADYRQKITVLEASQLAVKPPAVTDDEQADREFNSLDIL